MNYCIKIGESNHLLIYIYMLWSPRHVSSLEKFSSDDFKRSYTSFCTIFIFVQNIASNCFYYVVAKDILVYTVRAMKLIIIKI